MGKLTTFWERQKERRDCLALDLTFSFSFKALEFFRPSLLSAIQERRSAPKPRPDKRWDEASEAIFGQYETENLPTMLPWKLLKWGGCAYQRTFTGEGDWFAHRHTIHCTKLFRAAAHYKENASNTLKWILLCFELANAATELITQHAIIQSFVYIIN